MMDVTSNTGTPSPETYHVGECEEGYGVYRDSDGSPYRGPWIDLEGAEAYCKAANAGSRKPYPYPDRWKNTTRRGRGRGSQGHGPFASQQKRIAKAVEEIANNHDVDKKSRIIELEQIAEEVYDVWEAMIDDLDHLDILLLAKRREP